MQEFLNEKFKVFLGGSVAGVFAGVKFLFIDGNIYTGFLVKLIGTLIIALFSGMITLFARDLYKHLNRKFKIFKNGDQKEDDETKAA